MSDQFDEYPFPSSHGDAVLRVRRRVDGEVLTAANERIAELEAQVEALSAGQDAANANIFPMQIDGTLFTVFIDQSTGVAITAAHATDGIDFSPLVEKYGQCHRLQRTLDHSLYMDGQFADVHIFGNALQVQAFKNACPSPEQAMFRMGFDALTYNLEPSEPTIVVQGYPAGDLEGAPERRLMSPFTRFGPVDGLYAFHSMLGNGQPGLVIGGMSGGRADSMIEEGVLTGVIVRSASWEGKTLGVIQPLTNSMELVAV